MPQMDSAKNHGTNRSNEYDRQREDEEKLAEKQNKLLWENKANNTPQARSLYKHYRDRKDKSMSPTKAGVARVYKRFWSFGSIRGASHESQSRWLGSVRRLFGLNNMGECRMKVSRLVKTRRKRPGLRELVRVYVVFRRRKGGVRWDTNRRNHKYS